MMTSPRRIITLTTDFGLKDHYVAAMKGTILKVCPSAKIIDITHLITRHNVREASYILYQSSIFFPDESIHVAVVDPSVGTERKRLAIRTKCGYLVGPDNGILIPAARSQGILDLVETSRTEYMASSISTTFEGRDVFAHIAGHLANGVRLHELGPNCIEPVDLSWGSFRVEPTIMVGEILHVDWFGNITTNIPTSSIMSWETGHLVRVNIGRISRIATMSETYCERARRANAPLVIKGSGGFLEIAVNKGAASTLFNVRPDSMVTIDYGPAET